MADTARDVIAVHPKPLAPINETAAIIQVIERAATNPNVDIDKMERLLLMQERIMERNAKAAFDAALSEMQPELPVIERKGKIIIKEKGGDKIIQSTPFALWEDINEAIGPVMAKYGFALSFRTGLAQDGRVTVTGILSHREGHREETTMVLPHDSTGSKNAVQAVGSSTSYGKRYTACALLNLTSRGEDDDANSAAKRTDTINDDQLGELVALMEEVGADKDRFLQYFKIEKLSELPTNRYADAMSRLHAKRGRA